MRNLLIAITLSLALIASQSTLAMPPKPAKCPSLSALQNSNFNFAKKQYEEAWTVVDLQNNYDTADSWTFLLFDIVAQNKQDAISIATNSVKNLTFQNGPIPYSVKERWACVYLTAEGEYAVSYTPVIGSSDI